MVGSDVRCVGRFAATQEALLKGRYLDNYLDSDPFFFGILRLYTTKMDLTQTKQEVIKV